MENFVFSENLFLPSEFEKISPLLVLSTLAITGETFKLCYDIKFARYSHHKTIHSFLFNNEKLMFLFL